MGFLAVFILSSVILILNYSILQTCRMHFISILVDNCHWYRNLPSSFSDPFWVLVLLEASLKICGK